MPEIVAEFYRFNLGDGGQGLDKMRTFSPVHRFELQDYAASDLRDFHRMCKARAMKVTLCNAQDLGFRLEPPECCGVDDPRAVSLLFGTAIKWPPVRAAASPLSPTVKIQWHVTPAVCRLSIRSLARVGHHRVRVSILFNQGSVRVRRRASGRRIRVWTGP
jgi:hypothetical protein